MPHQAVNEPNVTSIPYWWRSSTLPESRSNSDAIPSRCDVAIVGAGIAGLSAALQLARAGLSVVVLDEGHIGGGASSRNFATAGAGSVLALMTEEGQRETALKTWQEDQESFTALTDLASSAPDRCSLEQVPTLLAVRTDKQLDSMQKSIARAHDLPVSSTLLSKAELGGYLVTDAYAGGLLVNGNVQFDTGRLMAHLAKLVREAGGSLIGQAKVHDVFRSNGDIFVKGKQFSLSCRNALVATNGYSGPMRGSVGRHLARGLLPMQANMVATAEMDATRIAEVFKTPAIVVDNRNNFYCIRMSQDRRRILFAARTGYRLSDNARRAQLGRALERLFPQLGRVDLEYSWPGMIAISRDWKPHAGFIDGVGYIAGCCGSGMTRHFGLGSRMAAAMIEQREPDTVYFAPLPAFPALLPKRPVVWLGARWYDYTDWRNERHI